MGVGPHGWDVAGRREWLQYPNGVRTSYGYDVRSRLTSLVSALGGAGIASHSYGLDAVGDRTSKTTTEWSETYGYDPLDRLTGVQRSAGPRQSIFGYDGVGNRLREQVNGQARQATVNDRNQLTEMAAGGTLLVRGTLNEAGVVRVDGQPARMLGDRVFEAEVLAQQGDTVVGVEAEDTSGNTRTERYQVTTTGGAASYSYDAAGNLTGRVEDGHTFGYTWNAENELVRVTRDGAEVARFAYDPLGRRVEKVAGALTYAYAYDGPDILRETRSGAATATLTFIHGPAIDEPLAHIDSAGQWTYYHSDGLGSIVRTTNEAEAVASARTYDAWGNMEQGANDPGYAFTGREWDPETGLYYYRARYYDPRVGRFISEDPIRFQGGLHLCRYVENNPVNGIDPLGLIRFVGGTSWPGQKPASDADIARAYAEMERLRGTLTEDVKQYFWQAYDVDIEGELTRGGDLVVQLARGNGPGGYTPPRTPYNRFFGTLSPTLDLNHVCAAGEDPDLFNANLLHELTHYFHQQGGWRPGFVNRAPALGAAMRAMNTTLRPGDHGPETFLAEIYQYGRWLTYGGGR